MNTKNVIAMDYGASTGRAIAGEFNGKTVTLRELHRFPNYFINNNGTHYWDVFRLFHQMLEGIARGGQFYGADGLAAVGIDTWGTDYGLLDRNGQLIGSPRCMRNADDTYVNQCDQVIPVRELYARTGIQTLYGNTVFQLYERVQRNDSALKEADHLLMMPDLLAYFLTGEKLNEYTMASTSMLYNLENRDWDREIALKLGIPTRIFEEIMLPGNMSFAVNEALCDETGIEDGLQYVPVGSHDTASAATAAALSEGEAFCSSGTWSIVGMELEAPVVTDKAYQMNFSNEGSTRGKTRLVKNIMGMWIVQQCNAQWQRSGIYKSWDEIVALAGEAQAFRSFINLESPEFYGSGHMIEKVQDYCRRTGQPVPETVGEIARCTYESLAMRYRLTMDQMEEVTGRRIPSLRIVGGGCQNALLNQFAANAMNREVHAGPVESACLGNVLVQLKGLGDIEDWNELKEVARKSSQTKTFIPQETTQWDEAYERYRKYIGA